MIESKLKNTNTTVVGIRTHKISNQEIRLFQQLIPYFGKENIYFIVDAMAYDNNEIKSLVEKYNIIYFTQESLNKMELKSDFPKVGWRCGDYFYYYFKEKVLAEYYWLIEPDVYFMFDEINLFFNKFEQYTDDLIMPNFSKSSRNWRWYEPGYLVDETVYQGRYPITRVSDKLIDKMLIKRKLLTRRFFEEKLDWNMWPNDESLTATLAKKFDFSVVSMNEIYPSAFSHFSTAKPYYLANINGYIENNSIVHPALDKDDFYPSFKGKLSIESLWNRIEMRLETALLGANTMEMEKIKNIVMTVAGEIVEKKFKKLKKSGKTRLSTVKKFEIINKSKRKLSIASKNDFELSSSFHNIEFENFSFKDVTPYCFDFKAREFWFVNSDTTTRIAPFFYMAQFDNAKTVIKVTVPELKILIDLEKKVLNTVVSTECPTFVFSIGLCGSILFSKLSDVCGFKDFSEPDLLTELGRQQNDSDFKIILDLTINALALHADVPNDRLVIKLRSGSSGAAGSFFKAMPKANYIFLKRNIKDWAKSFIEKFNCDSHQLTNALLAFNSAIRKFKSLPTSYQILQYEEFSKEPILVYTALTKDKTPSIEIKKRLMDILKKDVQGSTINLFSDKDKDLNKKVDAFYESLILTSDDEMKDLFSL